MVNGWCHVTHGDTQLFISFLSTLLTRGVGELWERCCSDHYRENVQIICRKFSLKCSPEMEVSVIRVKKIPKLTVHMNKPASVVKLNISRPILY